MRVWSRLERGLLPLARLRKLLLSLFFALSCLCLFGFSLYYESDLIEIYSHSPLSQSEQQLGKTLDSRITEFQKNMGIYPSEKASIYIIRDEKEYRSFSLGRAQIVEHSNGFYDSKDNVIRVRAPEHVKENYVNLLLHEYIHWYIDLLFQNAPLWFHEGLATSQSQPLGYERYLIYLRESLINPSGNLFRLSYSYPQRKEDWDGFYISSTMALRFMQEQHEKQWERFWSRVAQEYWAGKKAHFSRTFSQSYGETMWDFHTRFTAHSKRQGYFYLVVLGNSLLIALLPFVMLIAAHKRRKKMKLLPDMPLINDEEMGNPGASYHVVISKPETYYHAGMDGAKVNYQIEMEETETNYDEEPDNPETKD
ncbi:MAG: hypothetical protein GX106_00230 [Candidatus Cloacimonetes bacterium]|nr:hypothetical protein [Candidatus Cloacimonadota bacterium]